MQQLVAPPDAQAAAREIWVTSDGRHWRSLGRFAIDSMPFLEPGLGVWCRRQPDDMPPATTPRASFRPWERALSALRGARVNTVAR